MEKNKIEEIAEEKIELENFIEKNSKKFASDSNQLKEFSPMTATFGYYNASNIKFDVSGYNLVYVDEKHELRHCFINPKEIKGLSKLEQLGERQEIEDLLKNKGYKIDDSEGFKNMIEKLLKNN